MDFVLAKSLVGLRVKSPKMNDLQRLVATLILGLVAPRPKMMHFHEVVDIDLL